MPTPRFRPRPAIDTRSKTNWKDNSLVIAVGVAATTAVFFMTVVIPLRVDLLNAKVERLTELSSSAASTAEELANVKRELAETRAALQLSLLKNPLQGQSVYPVGFDEVVLGTPEAELISRYPGGEWDEERAYYSVKAKIDNTINEVTYYLQNGDKQNSVSHILFHLKFDEMAAADLIQKHLLTTFGEPHTIRRGNKLWKANKREWVELGSTSYVVHPANSRVLITKFNLTLLDDIEKK